MKATGIAATLISTFVLLACSSSDTILALNVNPSGDVALVSKMHVKITQGSTVLDQDITDPPTRQAQDMGQAGGVNMTVNSGRFYRRLTLPESFSDGEVQIVVDAYQADGNAFPKCTDQSTTEEKAVCLDPAVMTTNVEIKAKEATAAFVVLQHPTVVAPAPAGGAGGAGGETSTDAATGGTTDATTSTDVATGGTTDATTSTDAGGGGATG